ncbi:MAG: DUF2784 family protein [Gemmatimonadota bacterium]
MIYRRLADLTLVVHLAFILFVVLAGLLALRWPALVMFEHANAACGGREAGYRGSGVPAVFIAEEVAGLAPWVDNALDPIL